MKNRLTVEGEGISFSYSLDIQPPLSLDQRHCHDFYEILYITEGDGSFFIEGSSYSIKPGDLLFIRPLEYHYLKINDKIPYERHVIHFTSSTLFEGAQGSLDKIISVDSAYGSRVFSARYMPGYVNAIFSRFEAAEKLERDEQLLYAKMLLSELIMILSTARGEKLTYSEEELGSRVIRFLNDNIEKNITLDHLARRFFVSKYYLCRAFKKYNGISIHGYINQKRVMYAKQLIEQGETASGAAYRVGFGDYSAFYRAYKKVIGRPPTHQASEDRLIEEPENLEADEIELLEEQKNDVMLDTADASIEERSIEDV